MYIAYINIYNTRYFIGLYKAKKYIEVLDTCTNGKKTEYKNGFIKNDDGIITIDGSKFTMPYENVTIIASFKSKKILCPLFLISLTISGPSA